VSDTQRCACEDSRIYLIGSRKNLAREGGAMGLISKSILHAI
jgi:hypothetical protein